MSSLTVIIPSKTPSNLVSCMQAIHEKEPEVVFFLANDGIDLATVDLSPFSERAPISGYHCPKPFIFARNINIALQGTGDSDVVLCNDDALLETRGGFSAMRRYCERHPEYGLLSVRVRGHASPVHGWPVQAWVNGVVSDVNSSIPFVCVYIPRAIIDEVGLLDERFSGEIDGEQIYGGEDDDYCYRIRQAGFKLGVFNGCVVDHGTLPSTFRGLNGSLPINATRKRFKEIHGFEMGSR